MSEIKTQPGWRDMNGYYVPVKNAIQGPMPPGVYSSFYSISDGQYWHASIKTSSDDLVDLPGLPTKLILDQMDLFWSKRDEFKKFGFLQKRGILLYGPPGCGKSSIVALLRDQLIKRGGIVFVPRDGFGLLATSIADFRTVEPDRPIMTLVEDLETYLESSNGNNAATQEKAALSFYDGELQIDNVIHVATTNKPELLADRFIRRPGRFDMIIGIHAPGRETREAYLHKICNGALTNKQAEEILNETEGLSLAYMREIATTYLVLNIPLKETIDRLKKQASQKYNKKTGFTIGFKGEDE